MSSHNLTSSVVFSEMPFVQNENGTIGVKFGNFGSLEPSEFKTITIQYSNASGGSLFQSDACVLVSDNKMLNIGLEVKTFINPNKTLRN